MIATYKIANGSNLIDDNFGAYLFLFDDKVMTCFADIAWTPAIFIKLWIIIPTESQISLFLSLSLYLALCFCIESKTGPIGSLKCYHCVHHLIINKNQAYHFYETYLAVS